MKSIKTFINISAFASTLILAACVQGSSPSTQGKPPMSGGKAPSSISFREHVRLQITPNEGGRKMRKAVYSDLVKECKILEDMMARKCRVADLKINPVEVPDGEPTIATVQVILELYGEELKASESKSKN